jgi:hypothetical protein
MVSASCGHTDRPEGVVERWLISLNQGKAGQPEKYASDDLSERIVPGWRTKDPGQLDVIEVGKAGILAIECRPPPGGTCPALELPEVPFRIVRTDGSHLAATAVLLGPAGRWRISRIEAGTSLRLPSQGGPPVASAGAGVWLGALGAAFLLVLLSAGLMATVGRRQTPT